MSDSAKEAVWLNKLVTYLDENNGAIAHVKEPRFHQKSKHILRRFHLIREIVARGDVVMERVTSTDNVTNPLTKPLAQEVFGRHCTTMGLMHKGDWL